MNRKEFNRIVGRRIEKARKRLHLTQEDVASQLYRTGAWLSKIEDGTNGLRLEFVEQLSKILRIDKDLLTGEYDYESEQREKESAANSFFSLFMEAIGIKIFDVLVDNPQKAQETGSFYSKHIFCFKNNRGEEIKCSLTPDQLRAFRIMIAGTVKQNLYMFSTILPCTIKDSDTLLERSEDYQIDSDHRETMSWEEYEKQLLENEKARREWEEENLY